MIGAWQWDFAGNPPPREMTAAQLKTQRGVDPLIASPMQCFEFVFGDTFVDVSEPTMDNDTVTSMAAEKTIRGSTSCQAQGWTLEPQEIEMPCTTQALRSLWAS
jgi:hypothetical protein